MPDCILQMFRVSQSLDRNTFYAEIMGQYVETGSFADDSDRLETVAELAQRLAMTIAYARQFNAFTTEVENMLGEPVIDTLKLCFMGLNNKDVIERIKETAPHEIGLDEIVNLMRFVYVDQKLLEMERYSNDPLYPENGSSKEFLATLHTMQESWLEMVNCPGICNECYIKDETERKKWVGDPVDEFSRHIDFPDTIQ